MTAAPLTLAHATLVDAGGVVEDGWVRFEGGTIAATGRGAPPVSSTSASTWPRPSHRIAPAAPRVRC